MLHGNSRGYKTKQQLFKARRIHCKQRQANGEVLRTITNDIHTTLSLSFQAKGHVWCGMVWYGMVWCGMECYANLISIVKQFAQQRAKKEMQLIYSSVQ